MLLDRISNILAHFGMFLALPAIFIGIPAFCLILIRKNPAAKFGGLYSGLAIYPDPELGLVSFRIHSYDGFLAWFTQTEHVGYASPDDAEQFIKRILTRNLTKGLFVHGGLLVPLVALPEYFTQRKHIRAQALNICADTPSQQRPMEIDISFSERAEWWSNAFLGAMLFVIIVMASGFVLRYVVLGENLKSELPLYFLSFLPVIVLGMLARALKQ